MNNRFLNFLGLARRSGSLILGGNLTENAVKRGNLKLLIIACDASDNTRKKFHDLCNNHRIPFVEGPSKDETGAAIGKGEISVIGVTHHNMAEKLKELAEIM